MILVPPAAPTMSLTSPFVSTKIDGLIEDSGLFPGFIKLVGEGGTPNPFIMLRDEKSSIWLLIIIPVLTDLAMDPNLEKEN